MLATIGIDEATAREHSVEWVEDALEACIDQARVNHALAINATYWGTVGTLTKEGSQAMVSMVETLTSPGGLVEPEPAVTDEDAIERLLASGAAVNVKVSADV